MFQAGFRRDVVVNHLGQVTHTASFDAWGKGRSGETWTGSFVNASLTLTGFTQPVTQRGYTGHEMVDDMGLIHMNWRIYDPRLARFLQADPFIQESTNTQSYNRYSYVVNNPLNATDPSGYFFSKIWKELKPFVGAIVGVALFVFCPACYTTIGAALANGVTAGAIGVAVNGGNILQGAVFGMFSAAGAMGSWFAAGFVGGFQSVWFGGEFGHGFLAAGIGAFGGGGDPGWGSFLQSAVLGGVATEITGGKFKNGAAGAAFMWAVSAGVRAIKAGGAHENNAEPSSEGSGGRKFGGQAAYDEAVEALNANESLAAVTGKSNNHKYTDKHYVVRFSDDKYVYRELGGAEIDGSLDGTLKKYNDVNGGGWMHAGGSCGKGYVCNIYRGATAESVGYGKMNISGYGYTLRTKSSVESVIAVMAHEYVHYSTGQAHLYPLQRSTELNFGFAQEAAIKAYRDSQ